MALLTVRKDHWHIHRSVLSTHSRCVELFVFHPADDLYFILIHLQKYICFIKGSCWECLKSWRWFSASALCHSKIVITFLYMKGCLLFLFFFFCIGKRKHEPKKLLQWDTKQDNYWLILFLSFYLVIKPEETLPFMQVLSVFKNNIYQIRTPFVSL